MTITIAFFIIASPYDNTKGRLWKVIKMSNVNNIGIDELKDKISEDFPGLGAHSLYNFYGHIY